MNVKLFWLGWMDLHYFICVHVYMKLWKSLLWDVRSEARVVDWGVTRDDVTCMWKGILLPHSL